MVSVPPLEAWRKGVFPLPFSGLCLVSLCFPSTFRELRRDSPVSFLRCIAHSLNISPPPDILPLFFLRFTDSLPFIDHQRMGQSSAPRCPGNVAVYMVPLGNPNYLFLLLTFQLQKCQRTIKSSCTSCRLSCSFLSFYFPPRAQVSFPDPPLTPPVAFYKSPKAGVCVFFLFGRRCAFSQKVFP